MQNFANKTVIITGASAGVGKACAQLFASHKANLVLIARGQEKLDEVAQQLSNQTKVFPIAMDVADADAYPSLFEKIINEFGSIHVLINNAGYHKRGRLENNAPHEYHTMVNVNLRAPIEMSAHALEYMKQAGEGAIINIASLAGRAPLEGAATYAASKAGMRAFSHSLHDEMRDANIHVGVICPGPISTGFILEEIDEVEDIVFSQPMRSAEQVAQAVFDSITQKKAEIAMPFVSGILTNISYFFPSIRRAVRPLLYARGRKSKQKYRNQ